MPRIISKQVNIYQTYQRRGTGSPSNPCLQWILYTGIWTDSKFWVDTCVWVD